MRAVDVAPAKKYVPADVRYAPADRPLRAQWLWQLVSREGVELLLLELAPAAAAAAATGPQARTSVHQRCGVLAVHLYGLSANSFAETQVDVDGLLVAMDCAQEHL